MKKTAVEWLIDESMKLVVQYMNGTLNEDTLDDVIYEIGTKAKEMEKQQHKETWDVAHQAGRFEGKGIAEDDWQTFEDHWDETYKLVD